MSHNSSVQELKNIETEWHLSNELAKFMNKFHHGKWLEIYTEYFQETSSVHSYQTRFANMENYFIHRVSSNAGKKSISYRGPLFRNEVEQNLKAVFLSTFCDQLQGFIFSQYYISKINVIFIGSY